MVYALVSPLHRMGLTGRKHTRMKRIAILQSNYIPWKGYFDIINSVDEFIIYDDAQYTRRGWRNRNHIKTRNGLLMLTVPVRSKGRYQQKISETEISGINWTDKHFDSIKYNYQTAPFFKEYEKIIQNAFQKAKTIQYLSEVNKLFIDLIISILGIKTRLSYSSEYDCSGTNNEKIIDICKQAGAGEYLTGPAAGDYLQTDLFKMEGIAVKWMDYSGYPEYQQLFPPFEHKVTILDLIFNKGSDSKSFMKSF
jgi:hypothetical protein